MIEVILTENNHEIERLIAGDEEDIKDIIMEWLENDAIGIGSEIQVIERGFN